MNCFVPKYPRTVAGHNWRAPLRHAQIEAIGKRADRLYRDSDLTESDRSRLLQTYSDLRKADTFLRNALNENRLPDVPATCRPSRFDGWSDENKGNAEYTINVTTGFVLRVSEFLAKLEQRYLSEVAAEPDSFHDDPF